LKSLTPGDSRVAVTLVIQQGLVEQFLFFFSRANASQQILFLKFAEAFEDLDSFFSFQLG
jgi:hypothetical protein